MAANPISIAGIDSSWGRVGGVDAGEHLVGDVDHSPERQLTMNRLEQLKAEIRWLNDLATEADEEGRIETASVHRKHAALLDRERFHLDST